jgi:succinoglycan biosynthesis transport protein ExoP
MLPISYVSTDRDNVQKVLDSVINNTIALANDDNKNFVALKDKIAVVDTASAPKYNSPNKMLLLIIGVVLGGVLGVVIAFIKELLNDKIADQAMIEDKLGIKCIGVITDIHSQGGKK